MINYPLAILKFTWSDTPWAGGVPMGVPYDDALINRLYLPLDQEWGVAGFWRKATFGLLNLEGSEVFPWRKLENTPRPVRGSDRGVVIAQAIAQAQAEEWPLGDFPGIVLLVAPRETAGDAGATAVGQWPVCLVQVGDDQNFCAHEMGHVLGFEHTLGPSDVAPPPALASYIDRYCVMGENALPAPAIIPPDAPPSGDNYWSGIGPLPAAATLCAFLPGFQDDTAHVAKTGPLTPAFRRTLRLRARDLSRRGDAPFPILMLLSVSGPPVPMELAAVPPAPPTAWTVELRRSAGWDHGLGTSHKPVEGVVVHSLRPINEFAGANDFRPRAVYEGVFPLKPGNTVTLPWGGAPAGDADRRFGGGALTVRVESAAPDLSWVEVTVGGSDLAREPAVFADFGHPIGFENAADESGFAEGVPIFICGSGNYHYTLSRGSRRVRSSAVAYGYDQPEFSWKVNGVPLVPGSLFSLHPNRVSVNVVSHTPLPTGGETAVPKTTNVDFRLEGNVMELTGDPAADNYDLEIQVIVREKDPAPRDSAPPTSATGTVHVENVTLRYETAYYDAVQACVKRVQDIDNRFSKSRRPGPGQRFRPSDSMERRLSTLNRIRQNLLTAGHGVLASQLVGVISALRGAGSGQR